jgi:hypothetical protein
VHHLGRPAGSGVVHVELEVRSLNEGEPMWNGCFSGERACRTRARHQLWVGMAVESEVLRPRDVVVTATIPHCADTFD